MIPTAFYWKSAVIQDEGRRESLGNRKSAVIGYWLLVGIGNQDSDLQGTGEVLQTAISTLNLLPSLAYPNRNEAETI